MKKITVLFGLMLIASIFIARLQISRPKAFRVVKVSSQPIESVVALERGYLAVDQKATGHLLDASLNRMTDVGQLQLPQWQGYEVSRDGFIYSFGGGMIHEYQIVGNSLQKAEHSIEGRGYVGSAAPIDGRRVAVGVINASRGSTVQVIDFRTGTATLPFVSSNSLFDETLCRYDSKNQLLVVWDDYNGLALYDLKSKRVIWTIEEDELSKRLSVQRGHLSLFHL